MKIAQIFSLGYGGYDHGSHGGGYRYGGYRGGFFGRRGRGLLDLNLSVL